MSVSPRLRVVAIMTHPVQYLSPWFRYIHAHAPEIDLRVVYAAEPTPTQQGVGFERSFVWDAPLRDGYESIVARPQIDAASFHSDRFLGLDVPEVTAIAKQLEPDVALLAGWHSITQVRAILGLHRAGIPLLYRGDTHLGTSGVRWPVLSRLRARHLLKRFSGYLAVGTRSRDYLLAMGAPEPAIISSPHAVDNDTFTARADEARCRRDAIRDRFGFSAQQAVVLYAGKLAAIKRPLDVIDAAAALDNAAVLIVGDGPECSFVEARARERGVPATFAGFLNQAQMVEAYVAADVLMVPGRETWGLVANEALACGLPVVMSDETGGSADLERPHVCEIATAGDVARFARKLSAVISYRRAGGRPAECEAAVRNFSFEAATRGLITAATFTTRNVRSVVVDAPARVIALSGNFVFAGGMERITFEGLAALRSAGCDVHALLNGWSSRPIAELAERVDLTWEVGYYDARLDGVFRHLGRMARAMLDVCRASVHLGRLCVRRRVSHVVAVDFRAVLAHAPMLAVCRLRNVDVVLRSGVAPTPTRTHRRLWRWIIARLVTRHIANSAFTARELQSVGVPAERIVTIPNVAPRRRPSGACGVRHDRRIVYVGQIIPEKGVLQLLDAVSLLLKRGYDVSLDVVGQIDGWAAPSVASYRDLLRQRASAADLSERVHLLGWREDIDAVLSHAAIHCCPSQPEQREGFGITVVEAKRAGMPSVVCPSGALPELIEHQRDGWITTRFDPLAIAEGLEWFLADSERLARARQAARESARRFDPELFAQRWRDVFGLTTLSPRQSALKAINSLAEGPR